MSPNMKFALGLLVAVGAGGAAGYYIATTREGRKALKAAEDVVSDVRLPDPSFAVEVPYTDEQFELLDDLVCECGEPVIEAASPDASLDEVANQIRDCVARELYPDFPWPPISGDHPTVSQLYAELGLIARRAVAEGRVCPPPLPSPIDIPIPQPNPGAIW